MPDAADLQIAGLVPLSTVDWPGKLAASIFLQGCPWRCVYCQNHEILDPRTPGSVPWSQVVELLQRRRGLLDGLVFSGGEATRQPGLLSAAQEVKALGFVVGLHTAGIYPGNLARLLAADAVDWVGLDIKALPEHYAQVVGRPNSAPKAWQCLQVLLEAAAGGGPEFEVRTTVVPSDVTADDAVEVARRAHEAGARVYALQQARARGTSGTFPVVAPGWDARCERMAAEIEAMGWERFTYRPA